MLITGRSLSSAESVLVDGPDESADGSECPGNPVKTTIQSSWLIGPTVHLGS